MLRAKDEKALQDWKKKKIVEKMKFKRIERNLPKVEIVIKTEKKTIGIALS